ncbi:hypothetical protein CVT24_002696 [Panaeolus cyanescens]|uniref:Uncharacterized protein n=1 Tax=Panaeolus cyanescens TaxID=181874 RepID=A0A409YY81_9AGAR|nr:hypothetical protein CVT24_002696 [Panaeolus cyanescens]
MAAPNELFTAFAFLGFLMCAIPFPWHLEAWNTGTCLYMAWTGLACLNLFINSIVWNGNAINWAPVWCDISARIIVGGAVAIPAASLCINRRLYQIASVKSVTVTRAEKRRAIMIDLAIGLGLPILAMILQYVPQGHRFDIFEDIGCFPFTYRTWMGFALVSLPPILIGAVSAVYSILSIIAFNKSRAQFNEMLSGYSNLSSNRYLRLMCLAGVDVLCTVPLATWSAYMDYGANKTPVAKFTWASTHAGFSRVDQIPAIYWRNVHESSFALELSRWLFVVCAIVFFGFFGFADEARKHYRLYASSVAKRVGVTTWSTFGGGSSTGLTSSTGGNKSQGLTSTTGKVRPVPPMHIHKEMLQRQGSISSFSDMSVNLNDAGGLLNEKQENEKLEVFNPTLSYGGITLSDVGGTLADYSDGPYSPTPSSGSSSAPSISESARGSPRPMDSTPSLHNPTNPTVSVTPPTVDSATAAKAGTHDIV